MLELLKDGTYIRYWLAVVVSFLGDAMTRVTLIYVVARLTNDPVLIAAVVFVQLLPSGLLGAFVGPVVDRFSKRRLLVGSDLARILVVLAMIPMLDSAWALLALLLLEGVGKAIFETARIAAVPQIVGVDRIPTAVALFQSTNWTVNLAGPALGGVLLAIDNVPAVLVIDAATFLISAILLGSMAVLRDAPGADGTREPYWRSLRTGMRGVLAVPSLRFLFVVIIPVTAVFGLFTANFNTQMLIDFRLDALEFGFAQAILAGGSVIGALLGPTLIKRYGASNSLLQATVLLFGGTLVALAPTQWLFDDLGLTIVMSWCLLAGFGGSLFQVPVANTLLRDLPEELRGRGVGLLNTVTINFTVVGVALGGVIASVVSVAGSIIGSGVLLLVFTAVTIAYASRTRSVPLEDPVKS